MAFVIQIDHMDVCYVNPDFYEVMNKKVYESIEDAMADMCKGASENGWARIKVFHVPNKDMNLKDMDCVDMIRTHVGKLVPYYESARHPMTDEEWDAVTWQDAADYFDITSYRVYRISDAARAELGDEMLVKLIQGGEPGDDPYGNFYPDEMEELMEVEMIRPYGWNKPDHKPHLDLSPDTIMLEELHFLHKVGFSTSKKYLKRRLNRHARYQTKKLIDYEIESYLR